MTYLIDECLSATILFLQRSRQRSGTFPHTLPPLPLGEGGRCMKGSQALTAGSPRGTALHAVNVR